MYDTEYITQHLTVYEYLLNKIAKEIKKEYKPTFPSIKAYLAAQIELDRALESLIKELKKAK